MDKKTLALMQDKYAELIVKKGLNFKEGTEVIIQADTDQLDFINLLVIKCYENKASKVRVKLTYRPILNTIYKYEDINIHSKLEDYEIEKIHHNLNNRVSFIFVESFDPSWVNKDVELKYMSLSSSRKLHIREITKGKRRTGTYTIVSVPSKNWSKLLFKDLSESDAIKKHWSVIFKCCHIKLNKDPLETWAEHAAEIKKHADFLNSLHIKSLHYKNSLGTDLVVGINENSHFQEAEDYEETEERRPFYSNIPTEEVFTSPNKFLTEGIVYASKPLCLDGIMIKDFSFRFHEGKIVEVHAKKGEEVLKNLISVDEGASYIGEAALVPFHSTISKVGLIFQNILYDENAACHIALGDSYTYTCNNHLKYKKEDFDRMGYNSSAIHVDFMIGTQDLEIDATTYDGKVVKIFKKGDFIK